MYTNEIDNSKTRFYRLGIKNLNTCKNIYSKHSIRSWFFSIEMRRTRKWNDRLCTISSKLSEPNLLTPILLVFLPARNDGSGIALSSSQHRVPCSMRNLDKNRNINEFTILDAVATMTDVATRTTTRDSIRIFSQIAYVGGVKLMTRKCSERRRFVITLDKILNFALRNDTSR